MKCISEARRGACRKLGRQPCIPFARPVLGARRAAAAAVVAAAAALADARLQLAPAEAEAVRIRSDRSASL